LQNFKSENVIVTLVFRKEDELDRRLKIKTLKCCVPNRILPFYLVWGKE